MSFTLVHSADWQLGKAFASFPADKQAILANARLQAIGRLAALARDGGAAHVLVAGDVFDRADADDTAIRQVLAHLAAEPRLTWHLLPGNHDPASADPADQRSLWTRARRLGLPPNVAVHATPAAAEIARGVWLLPAPLTGRRLASDPTAGMDATATPEGALRIGLAHGSIRGFGGSGRANVDIAPDRASRAGLAYLALGDWHGAERIDARTWYSGTPEPDRFQGNKPGHALVVRLPGPGLPPLVEMAATGHYTWVVREARVDTDDDLQAITGEVAGLGSAASRTLLRLAVTGTLTVADMAALEASLDRLETGIFHLERDLDRIDVTSGPRDLATLGVGDVRDTAERLALLAADAADSRSRIAGLALRRLHDLARKVAAPPSDSAEALAAGSAQAGRPHARQPDERAA